MAKIPTNNEVLTAKFISEIQAKRAELVADLASLSNVLLGQGFVVLSGAGIALKFKVEGQQVTEPVLAGGPHQATRFSRTDAENVADAVTDGNGNHGRAVHICVALKDAIEQLDSVLAMITAK